MFLWTTQRELMPNGSVSTGCPPVAFVMIHLFKHINQLKSRRGIVHILAGLVAVACANGQAQQVERVAEFEQWPGVSQMISYRDRIWLVNSEPFTDTNSADVYSYSIDDDSLRYERSLFTQDVGAPVIYNGLLHWPFEDPRRSAGSGEYAVTDGVHWQWRTMQSGSVMHVHAMNVCDGDLVAATGSWTGQLHRLGDNNEWQVEYDYPAAENRFSRIVSVAQLGDDCLLGAAAKGKDEAKLLSLQGDEPEPAGGWPSSERVDYLTRHQQALYAFSDAKGARQLIRYDGEQSRVILLPDNHRPRAMHSDGDNLWLVAHNRNDNDKTGSLWQYTDNHEFKLVQYFEEVPISLASLNGAIAIGTYAKSGAALLLYKQVASVSAKSSSELSQDPLLPVEAESAELDSELVDSLYKDLLDIISDPENTASYARILRRNLGRHPELKTPEFGAALMRVLSVPIEGEPTTMFTGQSISRQDLIHWFLITTLAINGHGRIEPVWINSGPDLIVPDSKKVFDPSIASIVASGWLQQDDKPLLKELFIRLNNTSDPLWVKSDIIGALTAITEQRFGYDVSAWNLWWSRQ